MQDMRKPTPYQCLHDVYVKVDSNNVFTLMLQIVQHK